MRHPISTNPTGTPQRCPTHRIRVRLPLATIEELDHLAALHATSPANRSCARSSAAGLVSDTPLQPAGPAPAAGSAPTPSSPTSRSIELAAAKAAA